LKRKISRGRRGLSTIYASLLFLLIVFSLLILLFSTVFNYNYAVSEQMRIEHERSQEKIIITELGLAKDASYITYLYVKNIGTITVKIRAIYKTNSTMTVFIADPSTYMESTYIEPDKQLLITPPPNATYITSFEQQADAKLTLATERGTKTSDYAAIIKFGSSKPPYPYNPSRYYIGPLELMFTAFYYRKIDGQTGNYLEPNWHPGWNITKSYGYIAWNITVRNIDNKTQDVTINKFSSFTTVPNESPPSDERTWYLEPPPNQETQVLIPGQIEHIIYKWDRPKGEGGMKAQQIYSVPCRCLVFLTFYGEFHWLDGKTTTYAQTVPFEAAITVE